MNSQDPAVIEAAKEAILQTINDNEARLTINGVYAKLPAGDYTVAESWSGDIVGAHSTSARREQRHPRLLEARGRQDDDRERPVGGSEGLEEPTPCPRVHQLHARREERVRQFLGNNGYQPPFTSINPDTLVRKGIVPETLTSAVVTEEMFKKDLTPYELPSDVDQMWLDAWTEIKAGA